MILNINGNDRIFHGDPRTPLLDVLRETFRLTGAKAVCREGFCGACMVHVDGKALAACLLPVGVLEGMEIITIEGIGSFDALDPIQRAFEEHDVVQCGMCFPGMVMSLTAFLRENPKPNRSEVKTALSGNLCRCTGYERIIDAVMSLQDEPAAPAEIAE